MAARRILVVAYDGFELLDLAGPSSVFSGANDVTGTTMYSIEALSSEGGNVRSGCGVQVGTRTLSKRRPGPRDTVLICGGEWTGLMSAANDETLARWLRTATKHAGRYGSVCAGVFVLATHGLLDGRRATTHWAATQELARRFPTLEVEPDALYVHDGPAWTSAGVSTGIDMALAMVEHDLGAELMGQVAKRLVVYARRPGNQSQFSALLDAQLSATDGLSEVAAWVDAHLDAPLRVADLAKRVGMSERTFYRRFTASFGVTPSKYVERVRLERARQLLEDSLPIKAVAAQVGFASEAGFRAAFESRFGLSPSLHRRMHAR